MKAILILCFCLSIQSVSAQRYRITWTKVACWSSCAVAGSISGGREAFHADPTVFEKRFKASQYGFFGSQQWQRNYIGGRYLSLSGQPNKHKSEVIGNFGRDYWHTSRYVALGLGAGSVYIVGCSKQNWKHKVFDLLISSAVFSLSSTITYNYLRK